MREIRDLEEQVNFGDGGRICFAFLCSFYVLRLLCHVSEFVVVCRKLKSCSFKIV